MIKEELRKEIEKEAKRRTKGFRNQENCIQSYIMGALDFIEKATNNPETNLNLSEDKNDEDYFPTSSNPCEDCGTGSWGPVD